MASAYGFRNIQNVVRKIKNSNRIQSNYDYIEIMACPSGKLLYIVFSLILTIFQSRMYKWRRSIKERNLAIKTMAI